MKSSSILTIALSVFVLFFFLGCNQLGKEIKYRDMQIFYDGSVSKDEASRLGDYLVKNGFNSEGSEGKTLQLRKRDGKYQVRTVAINGSENDKQSIKMNQLFALELSRTLFNNSPVEIHACDRKMNTLKIFQMETAGHLEKYTGPYYEVTYPSTWLVKERPSAHCPFSISPALSADAAYKISVNLLVDNISNDLVTIEEYTDGSLIGLRTTENFKLIEKGYEKMGNLKCARIVFNTSLNEDYLHVEQRCVIKNNVACILTLKVKANCDNEDALKAAHDVFNSFTFTD